MCLPNPVLDHASDHLRLQQMRRLQWNVGLDSAVFGRQVAN